MIQTTLVGMDEIDKDKKEQCEFRFSGTCRIHLSRNNGECGKCTAYAIRLGL